MSVTPADRVSATAIIEILYRRKGFDGWWDEIGSENRQSIKRKIAQHIARERKLSVPTGTVPSTTTEETTR